MPAGTIVVGMVPSTPPILPPQRSMTRVTAMATTAERTAESSTAVSTVNPPASPKLDPRPRHRARGPRQAVSRAQAAQPLEAGRGAQGRDGGQRLPFQPHRRGERAHNGDLRSTIRRQPRPNRCNARSRSSRSGAAHEEHRALQRPRPPQARARAHPSAKGSMLTICSMSMRR